MTDKLVEDVAKAIDPDAFVLGETNTSAARRHAARDRAKAAIAATGVLEMRGRMNVLEHDSRDLKDVVALSNTHEPEKVEI